MLTVEDWDHRFSQQAYWTQNLRKYIYQRIGLEKCTRIMEIGCGTGAILRDFDNIPGKEIFGLDISQKFIRHARHKLSEVILTIGDALSLPYKEDYFDIVLCHFFLLWISDPIAVLLEIKRILKKNGMLLILAEPDYGGRLDYPNELGVLGEAQTCSLINQGANPFIGRRLGELFHTCDLSIVEMGVLGGNWGKIQMGNEVDREWEMLIYDLSFLPESEESKASQMQNIEDLKKIHVTAIQEGARVLYVPTFYAWGYA